MLRTHQTFKEGRKRVTIQYMPAGESVIDATVNGQPARRTVRVDGKTAARLQKDLEAAHARSAAGQAAAPCGYFDHRSGPASFRPVRFIDGGSRGVLLEVELTEAGRKALEGGDYGYFSPNFRRDKATGEVLGLRADTVEVGSLVNDPQFKTENNIRVYKVVLPKYRDKKKSVRPFITIYPVNPENIDESRHGKLIYKRDGSNT